MAKQRFSDLPPARKALVVATGIVQVTLFVAAQVDITRRSASELRGSKRLWRLLMFVNVVGPLAYFLWGRRRKRG